MTPNQQMAQQPIRFLITTPRTERNRTEGEKNRTFGEENKIRGVRERQRKGMQSDLRSSGVIKQ